MTEIAKQPLPRGLKFGLWTLLLVVLVVAGLFGGFRYGFDRGYRAGAERRNREAVEARVYPIKDLIQMHEGTLDYDSLIELITTSIEQTSWDEVGGPGSIAPHEPSVALVISQTAARHAEIETLFSQLRAVKKQQAAGAAERDDTPAAN